MTNFLGTPVRTGDGKIFGNLYLANKRDGAFTDEDEALLAVLGRATGLIIDQTQLREQVRSYTLLEERNRLARDLHDSVIQRLFAVGLSLQATLMAQLPPTADGQINLAIDELDETIREIRTTIFEITRHDDDDAGTLRGSILRVIDEIPAAAALHVDVAFDGPLDSAVGPECREAVVMSLREMLSNVVRHANATRAIVTVTLRDNQLSMLVKDNGTGVSDAPGRGRGTGNLTARALEFDGGFDLSPNPEGGSIATWRAQKVKL
jgi:signal transduction histidine kinase